VIGQVPAVKQVKQEQSSNGQDLRPAVFIKDLKKRSIALEEEKAQHFNKKKAAPKSQKETQPTNSALI